MGPCTDSRELATYDDHVERETHEFRVASPADRRFQALLGVFCEDRTHDFDWEWHVLGPNGLNGAFTPAAVEPPDIYWTIDMVRGN